MDKVIELKFKNSLNKLAGNKFGERVYNEQVKEKVDFKDKVVIVFPEIIEDIAISFVQGFTKEILEKIPKNEFFEYFCLRGNSKVIDKFQKSLFY